MVICELETCKNNNRGKCILQSIKITMQEIELYIEPPDVYAVCASYSESTKGDVDQ